MATGPSNKEILLDAVTETLGKDALATVKPHEAEQPSSEPGPYPTGEAHLCITQQDIPLNLRNSPVDIVVGLNKECPRWVPGSVVKWAVWQKGFSTPEDANFAANQFAIATQVWNDANIGVTFEWVHYAKDATFVLCHGGAKGGVLASAFFPNGNDLDYVFVYDSSFRTLWKPHMWRIFVHELGHVLGLRHEFAIEREGLGAVRLGQPDENSIMTYRKDGGPPELQKSDVEWTKVFYSLKADADGNPPKVGNTEVVDYTPR